MIKTLLLQNFQAHERRRIDFDPRITMIVGSSDVGKTAIVRALSYLTFNTPSGLAFIRDGFEGCVVTLKTDKHTVKRKRSKSVNYYEVDGKKLDAVGRTVPEDVRNALNLSELNFQYQHDSPLWLSDNAGQVAKNLNEIVNLDLIDRVLARLGRQFKSKSTELTVCQNRLNKATADTRNLEWVLDADEEYKEIERFQAGADELASKHTKLLALVTSIDKAQRKVDSLGSAIGPMKKELMEIQRLKQKADELEASYAGLKSLVTAIDLKTAEVDSLKKQLEKATKELKAIRTCPVCEQPLK